jgi:hypothetical protein
MLDGVQEVSGVDTMRAQHSTAQDDEPPDVFFISRTGNAKQSSGKQLTLP